MSSNSTKEIKKKIVELEAIYNNFIAKLNDLRSERNEIINAITKRIEEEKMKEVLDKLKKI